MSCRISGRVPVWISIALVLGAVSCAERERLKEPSPGEPDFTLGPITEYAVPAGAGAAVADSISGGSFVFPDGGSGTLSVARLLETPRPVPAGARGFWVEYQGDETLEFRLAGSADSIPCLYIYGFGDVSPSVSMESPDTWWPVMPEDTLSNPAVFPLVAPGRPDEALLADHAGLASPATTTATPIHSYRAACRKLPAAGDEWFRCRYLKTVTELTIHNVIQALPPALRDHATSETAGRLALRSFKALPSDDISAYSAFIYHQTYVLSPYRRLYPMLSYVCSGPKIAHEGTVAPEVGHYFTHVFFGDDAFEAITQDQLLREHEFGTHHPQRHMLEEYAMIVDYFKNGDITGGIDVEEPNQMLLRSPSIIDVPGLEGYATCLMARMTTSQDTILNFDYRAEDIAVVGMGIGDVLGILYTEKPVNINQLRGALATSLAARNKADRLPVVMERTGWSYHGGSQVLDEDGYPIPEAEVQSVCKVASLNSREYFAPLEPVITDAHGQFMLPRIFPGTNAIRVTTPTGSQDFTFTVDPSRATDNEVSIPQLQMQQGLLSDLQRMKVCAIYCEGIFTQDDGYEINDLFTLPYASRHQGQWSGNEFIIQYADSIAQPWGQTTGEQVQITVTFSANGRTVTRLQCTVNEFVRWNGSLSSTATSVLDVDELPLTASNTEEPGHYSAYYNLYTGEIAPKIRTISYVTRYYPEPVTTRTVTEYNWTDTLLPGRLGVAMIEYFGGGQP